jgi:hypothetical protein
MPGGLPPRPLERLVRQPVQRRIYGLRSGDRRLNELSGRYVTAADPLDERDRIVVTEGIVAERMNSSHGDRL